MDSKYLLKRVAKGFFTFSLAIVYLAFFIPIWLINFFASHWTTNIGLWSEIFASEERLKRDKIHQESLRKDMHWIDKSFLLLLHIIRNW